MPAAILDGAGDGRAKTVCTTQRRSAEVEDILDLLVSRPAGDVAADAAFLGAALARHYSPGSAHNNTGGTAVEADVSGVVQNLIGEGDVGSDSGCDEPYDALIIANPRSIVPSTTATMPLSSPSCCGRGVHEICKTTTKVAGFADEESSIKHKAWADRKKHEAGAAVLAASTTPEAKRRVDAQNPAARRSLHFSPPSYTSDRPIVPSIQLPNTGCVGGVDRDKAAVDAEAAREAAQIRLLGHAAAIAEARGLPSGFQGRRRFQRGRPFDRAEGDRKEAPADSVVISVRRTTGQGYGLKLGSDEAAVGGAVRVVSMSSNGPVGRSGRVKVGDVVIAIDGERLAPGGHARATYLLATGGRVTELTILSSNVPAGKALDALRPPAYKASVNSGTEPPMRHNLSEGGASATESTPDVMASRAPGVSERQCPLDPLGGQLSEEDALNLFAAVDTALAIAAHTVRLTYCSPRKRRKDNEKCNHIAQNGCHRFSYAAKMACKGQWATQTTPIRFTKISEML